MPAGDRTGPMGMGPMTGRGAGYCAGYGAPGYVAYAPGWGYGRGFGRGARFMGRGFGRGFGIGYDMRWGYPRMYYGGAGYGPWGMWRGGW